MPAEPDVEVLDELRAKALVERHGIPTPRRLAVATPDDLNELPGPPGRWVCKVVHSGATHKSELGLVRTGVHTLDEVRRVGAELLATAAGHGLAEPTLLVEEQHAGMEFLVGVASTELGRALLVGLGGVHTETISRTAMRLLPVSEATAADMLDELGAGRFRAAGGWTAESYQALIDLIERVGRLAEREPGLVELDLNPVLVDGAHVVAVDAMAVVATAGLRPPGGRESPEPAWPALFAPGTVAVVGATTGRYNRGRAWLRLAARHGFTGRLVAVSRKPAVDDFPTVQSLAEVPPPVDMVVCEVAAEAAVEVTREAVARGIPWVCVRAVDETAPGDTAADSNGAGMAERLARVTAGTGTRVIGPGALGPIVPAAGIGPPGGVLTPGATALLCQSGVLFLELTRALHRRGQGVSAGVAFGTGNSVSPGEWVGALDAHVPDTSLVMHLEGVGDGAELVAALRGRTGRYPAVVLKGGRTNAGRRAAQSHTGSLTGDGAAWLALEREGAIFLADSVEAAADAAHWTRVLPAGCAPRLAILTPSGGQGVLWCDAAEPAGLTVDLDLVPADRARHLALPPGISTRNPIDLGNAYLRLDVVDELLGAVLDGIGSGVVLYHLATEFIQQTAAHRPEILARLIDLVAAHHACGGDRVRVAALLPYLDDDEFRQGLEERLRDRGVPVFADGHRAITTLGGVLTARRRWSHRAELGGNAGWVDPLGGAGRSAGS